jgi:hypothetical protein
MSAIRLLIINSMPTYHDIVALMTKQDNTLDCDSVRRNYILQLSNYRKRAVICYYANFKQQDNGISDDDIEYLMPIIHKIGDIKKNGVDIILHTPGGSVGAAERITNYLTAIFQNDVEIFIPQLVMSAGTMIACIAKTIYMGKESHIGPADPSISGISTAELQDLFEKAKDAFSKNEDVEYYKTLIDKYPPHLYNESLKALTLAKEIIVNCLNRHSKSVKNKKIAEFLLDKKRHLIHDRGIPKEKLIEQGLNIKSLEDDNALQDIILSIHHSFIITMQANNQIKKIIENHNSTTMVAR